MHSCIEGAIHKFLTELDSNSHRVSDTARNISVGTKGMPNIANLDRSLSDRSVSLNRGEQRSLTDVVVQVSYESGLHPGNPLAWMCG